MRPHYAVWIVVGLIFLGSVLYLNEIRSIPAKYVTGTRTAVSVLSSIISSGSRDASDACPRIFSRVFQKWVAGYRKCLVDQVRSQKKTFWGHLHAATDKCLGAATWQMLDVKFLQNRDDVKLVMLRPKDPKSDKCTEVTLGIGNDIEAEKKLREIALNCTFYGADPILASGKVYKEIGKYFEIAVSAEAGVLKASVLEGGKYHPKNVSTVTLVDFLRHYAKVDKIDFMFMDNEGAEYSLLWQFMRGGLVEKEGFSICQLSVELHGPWQSYGVDGTFYENLITALINNSAFVPLWSAPPQYHVRSFYLNVEDKYCVEKFLQSRFCLDS